MTDRGLPSVDGAPACPFVAFEHDRDARATSPDHRHRCFAEPHPAPRALAHQEAYCLSSAFPVCPTFQDWARREAATATGAGTGSGSGAGAPGGSVAARAGSAYGGGSAVGGGAAAGHAAAAGAGAAAGGGAAGGYAAGATGVAAGSAAAGPAREPILRATRASSEEPQWPSAPAWPAADLARRHAARVGADLDDDEDDSQAPAFMSDRAAEPGRGLAGSPADRFARSAEPAGARPAWPESDDGTPGRKAGAGTSAASAGAASAAAAGGLATRAARSGSPPGPTRPGYEDAVDDFYADRQRFAGDDGRADEPVDVLDRAAPKRRGFFNRDKRPKVGDTRRDIPEEPAWEQPRRYEAYPALKTRRSLPVSRLILAVLALGAAAVGFFLLPGLLGIGNPALPGPSATVGASPTQAGASVAPSTEESIAPTPLPTPTPLTYTVVRGDTLTKIAKKFGVTVEQILAANPQIKNPNNINVGDVIVIPTGVTVSPTP
jgi:hypothetical protein